MDTIEDRLNTLLDWLNNVEHQWSLEVVHIEQVRDNIKWAMKATEKEVKASD